MYTQRTDTTSPIEDTKLDLRDIRAFEEVVATHSQALLQQAYRLTRDRFTAEDIVQDVFTTLWEKRHTIAVDHNLPAYLRQMLKNNFLRRVSRDKLHEETVAHLIARMNTLQETVIETLSVNELNATIAEVLETAPEHMKRIFVLRDQDLTLRQIAEALGLSEHTVKQYHASLNRKIKHAILKHHPHLTYGIAICIATHITKS